MSIRPILIASLLPAAGCAHGEPPLPTCDGSARRPANPHGSVLDGTAPSTAAEPAPAPARDPAGGGCA